MRILRALYIIFQDLAKVPAFRQPKQLLYEQVPFIFNFLL